MTVLLPFIVNAGLNFVLGLLVALILGPEAFGLYAIGAATIVLNGKGGMPSFRDDLSDADIAAALTYVRAAWGNKAQGVPAGVVASVRRTGKRENPGAALTAH